MSVCVSVIDKMRYNARIIIAILSALGLLVSCNSILFADADDCDQCGPTRVGNQIPDMVDGHTDVNIRILHTVIAFDEENSAQLR